MDKIKAMGVEEITEGIGAGGFDLFAGVICLKTLRLVAKGASTAILESSYSLNETMKVEEAVAEANKTVAATTKAFKTLPAVIKVTMEEGSDVIAETLYTVAKNPEIVEAEENFAKAIKKVANAANERGKAFEKFLEKKLGGKGSFKVSIKGIGTREFDGAVGNILYEAKSGEYWDMLLSSKDKMGKFKGDMLKGLDIAKINKATYELYSATPIPKIIKEWLTEKGIKFKEWL